jgi:protease-4
MNSFWQYLKNYFTIVGFVVTLMMFFSFAIITLAVMTSSRSEEPAPKVSISDEEPSTIHINLSGRLVQRAPKIDQIIAQMFGDIDRLDISEFRAVLRKAAVDDRVVGAQIEIGSLSGNRSDYLAMHEIIKDFSTAKPTDVILHQAEGWNYLLATAGSHITLTPGGGAMIPGPVFNLMYFGEAIRKVGVDLEVIKAGKFKSAFEPFIADAPSQYTLEQYGSMEASLRHFIVQQVASNRGVDEKEVEAWFKQSIFRSDDAVERKLVDAVGHKQYTFKGKKPKISMVRFADKVKFEDYVSLSKSVTDPMEEASGSDGIGFIEAIGEIRMSGDPNEDIITPRYIENRAKWAMEDDDVKVVVIHVVSPGGSALASEMMFDKLALLAEKKPIVVSMGDVAASGGYYLSVAAKQIFANPSTITGSIGVISMVPNFEPIKDKYGVSFYTVTQSDRQALLDPGSKSTSFDKQLLESMTDEVYTLFKQRVSTGRTMEMATVEELAQGRVYTGIEALKLGLVDQLGGLNDAFRHAKELAGFDPEKLYPVLTYKSDRLDFRECLMGAAKALRCLREMDSQISVSSAVRAFRGKSVPVHERVIERISNWVSVLREENHLALWPGYYALGETF